MVFGKFLWNYTGINLRDAQTSADQRADKVYESNIKDT